MRYEVPFVPDQAYVTMLAEHGDNIAAVYFRLGPDTPDGRLPGYGDASPQELAEGLRALPHVPRLGLLNAVFHGPDALTGEGLRDLLILLEGYLAADAITGIVYADHYLLTALSDAAPEVARALSAIPSINFRLDRFERITTVLEAVADTNFVFPKALIIDRDCNRDTARLAMLREQMGKAYPSVRLGLMANEGCLYSCPFKTAHDAHIAMSRLASCPVGPDINRDLGCLRSFVEHPERFLASPFIRPEDVRYLEGVADFMKICGRTRPVAELTAIVEAYLSGSFSGNLPWLLDTQEVLSGRIWLENSALPEDFFARTDGCSHRCRECGYCEDLVTRFLTERELALPRYEAV